MMGMAELDPNRPWYATRIEEVTLAVRYVAFGPNNQMVVFNGNDADAGESCAAFMKAIGGVMCACPSSQSTDSEAKQPAGGDECLSNKLRELANAIQVWDGETPAALLLFEAADKLSLSTKQNSEAERKPGEDVERVARAIYESNGIPGSWDMTLPMALSGPQMVEKYTKYAKAAKAALEGK